MALEYLRAEAERIADEQPGPGALLVSVALASVRDAVQGMVDLMDSRPRASLE